MTTGKDQLPLVPVEQGPGEGGEVFERQSLDAQRKSGEDRNTTEKWGTPEEKRWKKNKGVLERHEEQKRSLRKQRLSRLWGQEAWEEASSSSRKSGMTGAIY